MKPSPAVQEAIGLNVPLACLRPYCGLKIVCLGVVMLGPRERASGLKYRVYGFKLRVDRQPDKNYVTTTPQFSKLCDACKVVVFTQYPT